jgi:acyl-CoA thioester hydrolase
MKSHDYTFRVGYPDTDQMGTIHHARYPVFYEAARWEYFRALGIPYSSIEAVGVLMPVIRMSFHFLQTAHYDDKLTVRTTIKALKGVRIWFAYELINEAGSVINRAEMELAFVQKADWKPCPPPDFVVDVLKQCLVQVGE